nr:hypothetical protein Q903MT_gene4448 [Picea sitchensis]
MKPNLLHLDPLLGLKKVLGPLTPTPAAFLELLNHRLDLELL